VIYAAVFQPDGKIVVAGESRAPFTLARLNPDGGFVVLRTGTGHHLYMACVFLEQQRNSMEA